MAAKATENDIEELFLTLQGSEGLLAGQRFRFEQGPKSRAQQPLPIIPSGVEGILTPIQLAGVRYALKLFRQPSPERRRRIQFLSALNLPQLHPLFEAAPCGAVVGQLWNQGLPEPLEVEGYLARFIPAQTLDSLVEGDSWDVVALSARVTMAAQLCVAVQILEAADLVHGDLQPKNILVSNEAPQQSALRIIDFDGFFHIDEKSLPPIPRFSIPTIGCDGYRHRFYRRAKNRKLITSDRLALAMLVYSVVVLRSHHAELRGGANLLPLFDQEDLDGGKLPDCGEITQIWPEGWQLLERAVTASSAEECPTPDEWLDALSLFGAPQQETIRIVRPSGAAQRIATLIIEDSRRRGRIKQPRFEVTNQTQSLADACPDLAWLTCTRTTQGRLQFYGQVPPSVPEGRTIVFHLRNLGDSDDSDVHRDKIFTAEVAVGERISWNFYEIKVA